MNKIDITHVLKQVQTSLTKHSPEILTGIGIAGMIVTTVISVKATPKAIKLLDAKKNELETEKLTKVETVKTTWKCYVPAVITGAVSISCLVGASSVHLRRNAALTAAYTLSETALREYRGKVVETIGGKKEKTVREAVAKDQVDKHPVTNNTVAVTGGGNTLCYDPFTDRWFKSDIDKLHTAENEVNSQMLDEGTVSLNDFYYQIGLGDVTVGYDIGWSYNRDGFVKLELSSTIANDGTPCIVLGFQTEPYYNYSQY